eukprot:2116257-Pleurochrysis_carterae.AAC.3
MEQRPRACRARRAMSANGVKAPRRAERRARRRATAKRPVRTSEQGRKSERRALKKGGTTRINVRKAARNEKGAGRRVQSVRKAAVYIERARLLVTLKKRTILLTEVSTLREACQDSKWQLPTNQNMQATQP